MRLQRLVQITRARSLLRQGSVASQSDSTTWLDPSFIQKKPQTGDPHPDGGIYVARNTVDGLLEAIKCMVNEGVRIGRVKKLGCKDPGQDWLVEVYKKGTNSPTAQPDGTWVYQPQAGTPGAIVLHLVGDQLTWTGAVYSTFEEGLQIHSRLGV